MAEQVGFIAGVPHCLAEVKVSFFVRSELQVGAGDKHDHQVVVKKFLPVAFLLMLKIIIVELAGEGGQLRQEVKGTSIVHFHICRL